MKEFFLSSLWIGIILGFLLGSGIYWGFNPGKNQGDENEDNYSEKIKNLEDKINDLNNKTENLDGRFYGLRAYLTEIIEQGKK